MGRPYDVVVAGGSIAGLAFAAEAAKRGISVLVAEEHEEIGEPEKCDGLVSLRGLRRYGYEPEKEVVQNQIASGAVHSSFGRDLVVNATALDVVVLDRSAYDKQVCEKAESWGATVRTGTRVTGCRETEDGVSVKVGEETLEAKYYVDATGPASSPRRGIIPAAKYEIEGDWIKERVVEVFLDVEKYPGFFAWVIPFGPGLAKVGAAGRGLHGFRALDSFLHSRPHKVIRKVSAPIYVGGPAESFVSGRRILVGESAGQVKPTTAGGIMTSLAGSVIAARWVSDSLQLNDRSLVNSYQSDWEERFLKEMKSMLRLRSVIDKMSNKDLDSILAAVSTPKLVTRLSQSDFDFHATALLGALGVTGLLKVARVVASAEAKSLLLGS
ncbi:MAG: NAD(P)/FAD-dependent oxidoreductase [Nitrososphaerales archaeon]|nr:NAD(P)/FAD-dependent oxidoreductase [Nitrososphaerales archaeon]